MLLVYNFFCLIVYGLPIKCLEYQKTLISGKKKAYAVSQHFSFILLHFYSTMILEKNKPYFNLPKK